jgi:hypothetical protein
VTGDSTITCEEKLPVSRAASGGVDGEFTALNVFITEQGRLKINELNTGHKEGKQNNKANPEEAGRVKIKTD